MAFREFGFSALAFFLTILNVNSIGRLNVLARVLVWLSLALAVQGVLAFHFGFQAEKFVLEDRVVVEGALFNPSTGRIRGAGFLADPNDLAQVLITALPLLFLAWRRAQWLRNIAYVIVPGVLLLYGVYLTRSRGGMLALLALALLAFRQRLGSISSAVLTAGAAGGLLVIGFTGGRALTFDASAMGRIESWSQGLMMLRSNPILGVGFHQFGEHADAALTAHNSFVLCFAELGLVGYFFWVGLLVLTLIDLNAVCRLPGEEPAEREARRWARALKLAIYAFLAGGFFLSRTYLMTLYLLLAMSLALIELVRRTGGEIRPVPMKVWVPGVGVLEVASIVFFHVLVKVRFLIPA
jgi:O-antigen ligase